ncbi:MAG: RDD family protein [Elusimicrobiaceae bacterium]|nr:RDD family protein [Elusimicrobiaceae bacterium]
MHFIYAWFIDAIVISLLWALLIVFLLAVFGKSIQPEEALSFVAYGGIFWLLTGWVYFVALDAFGKRSCGKKIMGFPYPNREERKEKSWARIVDILLILALSAFLFLILWGSTIDPLARGLFVFFSPFLIIFVWIFYGVGCKIFLEDTLGTILFKRQQSKTSK